jgi:hypothetical protein
VASVPKKTADRFTQGVAKFKRILKTAHDRDLNESDTVAILKDILGEVFGYDKYTEITSEVAIRGTYCDLAVKVDDNIQFLIEVKAVGLNLKENHLRQAVDYGAKKGVQWVVLSNGIDWELYRLRFERPISFDLVAAFNFLTLNPRKAEDREKLIILAREGLTKSVREDFYERVKCVNRFVVAALTMTQPVLNAARREIRKLSPGLRVDTEEIEKILRNEVLKRDVIEGIEASRAVRQVARLSRKPRKMNAEEQINPEEARSDEAVDTVDPGDSENTSEPNAI